MWGARLAATALIGWMSPGAVLESAQEWSPFRLDVRIWKGHACGAAGALAVTSVTRNLSGLGAFLAELLRGFLPGRGTRPGRTATATRRARALRLGLVAVEEGP